MALNTQAGSGEDQEFCKVGHRISLSGREVVLVMEKSREEVLNGHDQVKRAQGAPPSAERNGGFWSCRRK